MRPLVEGLQQFQPAVVAEEHLSRMGVEGEDHGLCAIVLGPVYHPAEQRLVAAVHAVKGARGDDPAWGGRKVGKAVVNLHEGQK